MNLLKKTVNRDLILSGNMVQAIMSIAIPVVINSFLQTMYNLTDTFWLGKIGTEQLAAINLIHLSKYHYELWLRYYSSRFCTDCINI